MSEPRALRAAAWVLAAALLVAGIAVAAELLPPSVRYPSTGPDLAPLYLGGWAVWLQVDVGDPGVQLQLWERYGSGPRPAAFHMPYPTTAAFLATPLAYVEYRDLFVPFWRLSAGALVAAGALAGALGGRGRASAAVAAAGAGLLALAGLDVCTHSLELAQINPLVVLLTTLGAVLLVRGRDTAAGAVLALGAAIKLLPLVLLLPALALRRWRTVGAAVGTLGLIAALTWAAHPGWWPPGDLARAWHQIAAVEAGGGPPVHPLWAARGLVSGLPTLVLLGLVARRPDAPGAAWTAAVLALAPPAVVAAGLAPPHEMLLMAPATVLLVGGLADRGWGWAAAPALALAAAPLTGLDGFADEAGRWSRTHATGLAALVQALAWGAAAAHLWARRGPTSPGASPG